MARNTRLYGLAPVENYIRECDTVADMDVIEGGLLDTYVLYHDCGIIEIFEEVYLNEWSSAYARHIYRKGLPKRWVNALEAIEA